MPCRRCLEDVSVEVDEDAHFIFSPEGDEEAGRSGRLSVRPERDELDLRPAVQGNLAARRPRHSCNAGKIARDFAPTAEPT